MCYHCNLEPGARRPIREGALEEEEEREEGRLVADGGAPDEDTEEEAAETDHGDRDERPSDAAEESARAADESDGEEDSKDVDEPDDAGAGGRSNVEITDEAEPATPKWEEPDFDDLPEFELGAEGPLTKDTGTAGRSDSGGGGGADPGAGMPNTARSPEETRIASKGTEAYVVALEVCARLPDDVRLPEEAADLVPAAVEAELEQDIQQFAAAEFGTQTPHVDTLSFDEVDGEVWLRLRIGLPPDGFEDLDPEAVESYALERLEGVL